MKPSAITGAEWMKVLRVTGYVAVSLLVALVPSVLAHNAAYLSLAAPINVALITLEQLFTPSPAEKTDTQAVVSGIVNQVTDTTGQAVTDPNAPR
jgi:hypothetical protein